MSDIREKIKALPDKNLTTWSGIRTDLNGADIKALLDRLERLEGAARDAIGLLELPSSKGLDILENAAWAKDGLREALK